VDAMRSFAAMMMLQQSRNFLAVALKRGRIQIANFSMIVNSPYPLRLVLSLAAALLANNLAAPIAGAQPSQIQTSTRKAKLSPPPDYPELARKMNIQGIARVLLTVAADGKVVAVKELGGNPILVTALVQAVKKWKYEPADHESEIEVKFEFVQNR